MSASRRECEGEGWPFARLVDALRDPRCYPAGDFPRGAARASRVEVLETHISAVLLAGSHAYKIKKPVDLGFLDFTSLCARRFYCEEELRLNRRTAPSLYLGVVPITQSGSELVVDGPGTPVEYALKMRRFPQGALLDRMAKAGTLGEAQLDSLASRIARFHGGLEPAGLERAYASPCQVLAAAMQNFDQIGALVAWDEQPGTLATLRAWTAREHAALADVFAARKREGFVRECHGDLHLGNIVMLEGDPVLFDCIEFNAAFRWIDVMSEIAFLVMDLRAHGLPQLAMRFLDRYLEATGDYAGLRVFRFYCVYRALVRAKVALIRSSQPGANDDARIRAGRDFGRYLEVAQSVAAGGRGALIVMHGLSGSGKSTVAARLAASLEAIHLRSDVERKRLHGLAPRARSASGLAAGIYALADTERTYARLAELARHAVAGGYPVIVDATFLALRHRHLFRRLAGDLRVPFAIVSCTAPDAVLRERVAQREARGADPSEAGLAVLERQFAERRFLTADESGDVIGIAADSAGSGISHLTRTLARRLGLETS